MLIQHVSKGHLSNLLLVISFFSLRLPSCGLKYNRQLIGSIDDVLDVVAIPVDNVHKDLKFLFKAAVVSNSALVQIVDQDFRSEPLVGHTDVVLSVDVSSDGYLI